MRTLLVALMIAGLMSTVGIYAASLTGTSKTIGGTGSVTVSQPAAAASVELVLTAGNVTGAEVTWTPAAAGAYTLYVDINTGFSTGSLSIPVSGTIERVADLVALSPSIEPDAVTSVEVVISED